MKRKTIIGIAFLAYIAAMLGMYFGVDQYIKSKDNRLRADILSKIDEIFAGRKRFVDIAYSGYKVGYESVAIPSRPKALNLQDAESKRVLGDLDKKASNTWEDTYGNLTHMYRIHYKSSDWVTPNDYEDGWNFVVLEKDFDGVYQSWIFPYAVGYIQQEYDFGGAYLPSVASAVNGAFEFYTTNQKSAFYDSFEKGCNDRIWSALYDAQNEYYHLEEDKSPRIQRMGTPLFEKYANDGKNHAYQNGFMYNGFYKVFIASTQPKTWSIRKYEYNPDVQDKEERWKYWAIGLTLLLLLVVIPLWIVDSKHQKVKDEDLYDKLKRLCNPANFISGDTYDKTKVDWANAIYKGLLETNRDDTNTLNILQQQAVTYLGINLIDAEKLAELKEKVNPKNFLSPYNPEKVALANELYSILNKESLTYNEMADVENRSKTL